MRTFVINLDTAVDRWKHYEDTDYHRWRATPYQEVSQEDSDRMLSYWNISEKNHLCKVACLKSHYSLWKHIVNNKINNVIILEDDALLINDTTYLESNQDGITYLGGATYTPKMTGGFINCSFNKEITKIDFDKFRVLMTMSYYIPNYSVADKLIKMIDSKKRFRAVDVMLGEIKNNNGLNAYISYPASFIERPNDSQIQSKNRVKYANEFYCLSQ